MKFNHNSQPTLIMSILACKTQHCKRTRFMWSTSWKCGLYNFVAKLCKKL